MNDDPDLAFSLVMFIFLGIIGPLLLSVTQRHRATLGFQIRLFLVSYVLRFIMSVLIYAFGLVNILKDEDASGWLVGYYWYKEWLRQGVDFSQIPSILANSFTQHHKGYYYFVASFFYLTDTPTRLPLAVCNCLFGALTVILAYRIARSLFSEWVSVRVGWAVCLFPSMIIWSAQTIKEPLVIFLETVALYGCVQLKKNGFSLRHVLLCSLTILLLIPFRFYAAYVAAAAVALSLLLPQFKKRDFSYISVLGVAAIIVPIIIFSGILVQEEERFDKYDLQYIEKYRTNIAVGTGSGVENTFDLRSPDGFILGALFGGSHLLLAPFPWQWGGGSARLLLTLPELMVWWWLFFFGVLPGLWYALRNRFSEIQPLLFFTIGMGLLYSLIFGNVGLVYRQRAQLLPWLLIFAMVGLEHRARRRLATARSTGDSFTLIESRS